MSTIHSSAPDADRPQEGAPAPGQQQEDAPQAARAPARALSRWRRPTRREVGFLAAGAALGSALTLGGAALTMQPLWRPPGPGPLSNPDPNTTARAAARQALLVAAQKQPVLTNLAFGSDGSAAERTLTATVAEGAGADDIAAAYGAIVDEASPALGSAGIQYHLGLTWPVNGLVIGVEANIETWGVSDGLRSQLIMAAAAAGQGPKAVAVEPGSVTVERGEIAVENLSTARPGLEQDAGVGAISYRQRAYIGQADVNLEIDPGVGRLDGADLGAWVAVGQAPGVAALDIDAADSGVYAHIFLADGAGEAELRASAPSILAAVGACLGMSWAEIIAPGTGRGDGVCLRYLHRNGALAVSGDTTSSPASRGAHADPGLATELLGEAQG
ncbi:MAG: hypothetical protein ACFNME_00625 [Actinomyces dentalis]